jgi:hypothetical protein
MLKFLPNFRGKSTLYLSSIYLVVTFNANQPDKDDGGLHNMFIFMVHKLHTLLNNNASFKVKIVWKHSV